MTIIKINLALSLFEAAFGRPAEKADAGHMSLECGLSHDLITYRGESFGLVDKDFVIAEFIHFISEGKNKKPGQTTIKTIICDLDGVLTNGYQYLNDEGEKLFKTFHARDKTAIRRAIESGIRVIIVSADDWNGAKEWVSSFNSPLVEFVHRKIKIFDECADRINWDETAGIGDDFIDLPFLEKCRLAYCPKDALSSMDAGCENLTIRLECDGGRGVFAEALIDIEAMVRDYNLIHQNKQQ